MKANNGMLQRARVVMVMGTRPEAIKMIPIIQQLRRRTDVFDPVVVLTAQHRQMLDQVLSAFSVEPNFDMNLMRENQSLNELKARVLMSMDVMLRETRPDVLLVQGDTTTAFAAAMAAFNNRIPVAHVEAGLRSYDYQNPFPEEANRRLTSIITDIHLAPTPLAQQNLHNEGVQEDRIVVTGNTVVDALMTLGNVALNQEYQSLSKIPFDGHRMVLVTSHRRESWGNDLHNICLALRDLVKAFPDVIVVYPVHMNPNVRRTVMATLQDADRIFLVEPLDYMTFIGLMQKAYVILTDSGGVQEEAPTFRKPLLVLRNVTERPEAFQAGLSKVIGTSRDVIFREASHLLTDESAYRSMSSGANPYGDGKAAERIAETLQNWWYGRNPLLQPDRMFQPLSHPHRSSRQVGVAAE